MMRISCCEVVFMAGYVFFGTLAAFGLICAVWISCGLVLPRNCGGIAVLTGPLDREKLDTARRWIWLREMGLLVSPLVALEEGLTGYEREWLACHGFEICSRTEIAGRLGIGEKEFD